MLIFATALIPAAVRLCVSAVSLRLSIPLILSILAITTLRLSIILRLCLRCVSLSLRLPAILLLALAKLYSENHNICPVNFLPVFVGIF